LTLEGDLIAEFRPEEIEAIEEHRFQPLDFLYWREGDPDFRSIEALVRSLERRPDKAGLRPAHEAVDLAVLKRLAEDPDVQERAKGHDRVRRLWAACGLPDFRKTGAEHHARLVARIYVHLTEGDGRIPQGWYAEQLSRLDNVQGDIDTLADRIAGVRTWAYIAHRADWLSEPEMMAERARTVEEKLSDALHERLTQRFVDRRTAVLMRDLGGKGTNEFPVIVDEYGEVTVGSYPIGRLDGFNFEVDPAARHADRKMLLATAERRLSGEYEKRAGALVADSDDHFTLRTEAASRWQSCGAAMRSHGSGPARTCFRRACCSTGASSAVSDRGREAVIERLKNWLRFRSSARSAPSAAPERPRRIRTPRPPSARSWRCWSTRAASSPAPSRQAARRARPRAAPPCLEARCPDRRARPLHAGRAEARGKALSNGATRCPARQPMPELPPIQCRSSPDEPQGALTRLGFALGPQMLRVDLASGWPATRTRRGRASRRAWWTKRSPPRSGSSPPPSLA
jgi:ATP-dependent RNA helicase SUPV3L1/SUV3